MPCQRPEIGGIGQQVIGVESGKPQRLGLDVRGLQHAGGAGDGHLADRRAPIVENRTLRRFPQLPVHAVADHREPSLEVASMPGVIAQCQRFPQQGIRFGAPHRHRLTGGAGGLDRRDTAEFRRRVIAMDGIAGALDVAPREQRQPKPGSPVERTAGRVTRGCQSLPIKRCGLPGVPKQAPDLFELIVPQLIDRPPLRLLQLTELLQQQCAAGCGQRGASGGRCAHKSRVND